MSLSANCGATCVHYAATDRSPDRKACEIEVLVDLTTKEVVSKDVIGTEFLAGLSTWEFDVFLKTCLPAPMFKDRVANFHLPEGFEVFVEPWPYGGMDLPGEPRRFFRGLIFALYTRSGSPDSNYYAYPLPIIPVMDFEKRELIRIDEPASGGVIDHCKPAEYVVGLLPGGLRQDLKPLGVVQPQGPSFVVT
ncbi:hypothetical protein diail_6598, partial [Diaporthe ilicicola]